MAEDCRISTALPEHPKTLKLQRRLGVSACWALVCLLLWVSANRSDGSLRGMSDEDIEIVGKWDGEPGAFVRALVDVRFLDGESDNYVIHDWAEHNPWAASRGERTEAARKAAMERWRRQPQAVDGPSDMRSASGTHASRMQPAEKGNAPTQPNPPNPNPTHTGGKHSTAVAVPPPGARSNGSKRAVRRQQNQQLAESFLKELGVPVTEPMTQVVASAISNLALRDNLSVHDAAQLIFTRASEAQARCDI